MRPETIVPGQRFGRLTAVSLLYSRGGRRHYLFKCDCGAEVVSRNKRCELMSPDRSCGCVPIAKRTTHGASGTLIYARYRSMLSRCYNKNARRYADYGGRGISVCEAWRRDFSAFIADMGFPPPGASLDRIDNNGHYSPSNCRWATRIEQANNTRTNILAPGSPATIADAARAAGVPYKRFHKRVRKLGWTLEQAASGRVRGEQTRPRQPSVEI